MPSTVIVFETEKEFFVLISNKELYFLES